MNKLVLITGVEGFIGIELYRMLTKEKNYKFRLLLRKKENYKINLKSTKIESIIFTEDLNKESQKWWEKVTLGVNYIFHIAWYVKNDYMTSKKNKKCYLSSKKIINAGNKNNIEKFIFFGSCAEYKDSNLPLETTSKTLARNNYTKYKLNTLKYLINRCVEKKNYLWLRIFYIYGNNNYENKLYNYIKIKKYKNELIYLSNPNLIRDFIHIKKAVKLIKNKFITDKGIVNICTGKGMTIKNFTSKVIKNKKFFNQKVKFNYISNRNFDAQYIVGKLR